MDIKKRVRAELRDLIEQKKKEQEAQATLVTEVGSLREEKEKLSAERQKEKDAHQEIIGLLKQEASFLKQEKENTIKEVEGLLKVQNRLEGNVLEKQQFILDLTQNIHNLLISEGQTKKQTREFLDKLDLARVEYSKQQILNHEDKLQLRFLQGKITLAKINLSELQDKIKQTKEDLDSLIKEQSRHAQWDEYLQAKENFLIEQYKLLGVKYVVYNSR